MRSCHPSGGLFTGKSDNYVVFTLDERPICLHLSSVERVVHAAEITRLPQAPEIVCGVLNLAGRIIPVFDIRRRFHLPAREMDVTDQLIIARTRKRTVAILVDAVSGVIESTGKQIISAKEILPNIDYLAGIIKLTDGLVLIHDLDTFLSLEEEKIMDAEIANYRGAP